MDASIPGAATCMASWDNPTKLGRSDFSALYSIKLLHEVCSSLHVRSSVQIMPIAMLNSAGELLAHLV